MGEVRGGTGRVELMKCRSKKFTEMLACVAATVGHAGAKLLMTPEEFSVTGNLGMFCGFVVTVG